ncbi:MAG: Hsp70 family protein, partial [Myxococcales bacterium]|nr:Hsp70 family protein [Myxococcales bacterium]
GGGTFDITLLDVRHNVFEVLSTSGDSYLGGDDFDNRLAQYMLRGFEKQYGFQIDHDPVVRGRLKQVGEKIKRQLSKKERAIVNVRDLAVAPDGRHCDLRFQVDRAGVHRRFQDIVQRTFLVCDDALTHGHMRADEVQGVVLVGGSTRMPLVREMVQGYFGQPPLTDINPDEVVAVGAAIQGAALVTDPFSPAGAHQPLLLDVTPRSLGVQVVSGYYDVLIGRNAAIPCEQTRVFATSQDNQQVVRLQIFQGESRIASENVKLGEIELFNLRPMPRGMVEIEVTFAIDADGIVDVTAKDRETGVAQQTRVRVTAGFSDEAVQVMRRRSQ